MVNFPCLDTVKLRSLIYKIQSSVSIPASMHLFCSVKACASLVQIWIELSFVLYVWLLVGKSKLELISYQVRL